MDKPGPHKRRSIHEKNLIDEINDHVKNNVLVTRSRSKKNQNNQIDNDDILLSEDISEDEEVSSSKNMNETYIVQTKLKNHNKDGTHFNKKLNENIPTYITESRAYKIKKISNSSKSSASVNESSNNKWITVLILIFLFSIIIYFYGSHNLLDRTLMMFQNSGMNSEIVGSTELDPKINDVKVTLRSLMSKYKNQKKDLWTKAYVGITNIIRDPKKPSIIILLGNKSDPLDCLAALLGNISSNALSSKTLQLTPDKFESDMGSVIESLRMRIQSNKAVIVWDLLNINIEALKAFHNLCDRINPLVKEVIFIITIISDDYNKKQNPLEFVEKELFKKLSGKIKDDAIQPLITRITDGPILTIMPEPTVTDCPLPKIRL